METIPNFETYYIFYPSISSIFSPVFWPMPVDKMYILYIGGAILVPFSYVGLIYAFDDRLESRDHIPNVRRRFLAAALSNIIGVSTSYLLLKQHYSDPLSQMGFSPLRHLTSVLLYPSLLTLSAYTGTLTMNLLDGSLWRLFDLNEWRHSITDLLWIRHAIMAPISEEIAFRACPAPLLKHCFGRRLATFIAPITFALSHVHHISDDLKQGLSLKQSLIRRAFQCTYTYAFGLYATHLFFQTGHILAPIMSHSICNLLGFPAIDEVAQFSARSWVRAALYTIHFGGFALFFVSMPFLLRK